MRVIIKNAFRGKRNTFKVLFLFVGCLFTV